MPNYNGSGYFGKVARLDLQNFTTGGVTTLDLTNVDTDLKGFYGGFTDGRYGYFVPSGEETSPPSGKLARVDLQNFTVGGVTVLNLTDVNSNLIGFYGGFTDGRYGYLVPSANSNIGAHGLVARIDLRNFTTGGVTILDLTGADPDLKDFDGGFTDGRYGYFAPGGGSSTISGKVARVDLQNFTSGGVTALDLAVVDPDLTGFTGGFSDGRYVYFVPYETDLNPGQPLGKVARVDSQNFAPGGVVVLNLTSVDSDLKGFYGGFTDGRYGYFVPSYNGTIFGKAVRVDLQNFTTGGAEVIDFTNIDPTLKGFYGGFSDGRYGYFVPGVNGGGVWSGNVARIMLFFGGGSP